MMSNKREAYWDNLKCVLMLLVVIGHAAEEYITIPFWRGVHLFIYSFHMPVFVFVSGYWHNKHKQPWKRILFLTSIGLLFRFVVLAMRIFIANDPSFSLMDINDISWFMFALAAYAAIVWIFKEVQSSSLLLISLVFSIFVGYDTSLGLQFQKTVAHLPFFLLGILLKEKDNVKSLFQSFAQRKTVSSGIVILTGIFCASVIYVDTLKGNHNLSDVLNRILWNFSYDAYSPRWGGAVRLVWYVMSFVVGAAFCSLIPRKQFLHASTIGQHTIQIFFWHRIIQYVLSGIGIDKKLMNTLGGQICWIVLSAGIFWVTSTKLFSFPLKQIDEMINGSNIACCDNHKLPGG